MSQDESRFMAPLQLAGRLIMENGGETYRVEETITRMGRAFGLDGVESFAVPSGVFVSYQRSDGSKETSVMRVHKGNTNLNRVNQVNEVSRQVEHGLMDCEAALARLNAIASAPPLMSPLMLLVGTTISAGGFTLMFGGLLLDCIVAGFASLLSQLLAQFFQRRRLHGLVSVLAGSVLCSLIPMLFHRISGMLILDATVAGALMPLLPGLAMTIAVQDTMRGDNISGLSSGIGAILTAVMVAFGALVAAAIVSQLPGGGL